MSSVRASLVLCTSERLQLPESLEAQEKKTFEILSTSAKYLSEDREDIGVLSSQVDLGDFCRGEQSQTNYVGNVSQDLHTSDITSLDSLKEDQVHQSLSYL